MPPTIVKQTSQPTSGSGKPPAGLRYRSQYIIFEASDPKAMRIEVLAGEAAPTASGGYAKWAHIPRPQRIGLTVFEGYEPMTLTVPILFDAVRENGEQEDVEDQIQRLEWMGGRGIKHHEGFTVGVGKPFLLQVYSAAGNKEVAIPLVPVQFQKAYLKWFIDDITWDEHPLRSGGGHRIRQAATVKLIEYVIDPSALEQKKESFTVHHTTKSLPSLRKLVAFWARGNPARIKEAIKVTLAENSHNKAIGSNPDKTLKEHTAIRIANRFLHV
jgi:hypothetical protein